ncbi:MAG: outer membrane beta-barrel protein [Blastocatellia bacterium]
MRLIQLIAGALILLPAQTFAQEVPHAEVFAGYSYFRPDGGGNLHGWDASVAVNVNRWLGVVSDFSGHYGSQSLRTEILNDNFPGTISIRANSETNVHTILFGPQISYRGKRKLTPFAHALFGASRLGARATVRFADAFVDSSISDIGFAAAVGGGVDMSLSDSVAVRLIQADYFVTKFGRGSQSNVRLSVGFILR